MSEPTIIFLMGKQRAGKDTVADYLVAQHDFTKVALADKVKELASELFGMTTKDRGLLISLGTKMREIDPDVWIKQLWKQIEEEDSFLRSVGFKRNRFVVPDVRFPNEYEFLKEKGGISIGVYADEATRSQRPGYDSDFEHDPTEESLGCYDPLFRVLNIGSIVHLEVLIERVLRIMKDGGCLL